MTPARPAIAAAIFAIGLTTAASAQAPSEAGEPIEPWMERITPGGRDVGVLSDSLRKAPLEFAFPVGFSGIYKVRGRDDLFVRQNGAMYGVFPRSEYVRTKEGIVAVWPAGTAFFIGPPPDELLGLPEADAPAVRPGQVNARTEPGRIGGPTDLRVRAQVGPASTP
ncbi:MAG: hypothetical protein KDA22_06600, partial [Phycisphaerales bacterium]|nr:hypothetical protein [Phycisphaerales bacterium]